MIGTANFGEETDGVAGVKERLKALIPGFYPTLIKIVSPVYFDRSLRAVQREFDFDNEVVLNLGSGCDRYHPKMINVDLTPYDEVDLRASIDNLPLVDDCADGIVSIAVLEHVRRPALVVDEMWRILKPGGRVFCFVPFMQGIHASPDDFQRYTPHGLEELFKKYEVLEIVPSGGPTSALLWILQEWLAIVLSFGFRPLYLFWYYLFFAMMPLKLLDALLLKHPFARNISSGFTIRARKPIDTSSRATNSE